LTTDHGSSKMDENGRNAVATLNIKNLPDRLYRKLQARARKQHRSVAQEVTHILEEVLVQRPRVSLLELQGLGKEVWEGVDSGKHVKRERASWD
jgi:plasmid stability protein